jgi:hypothetical protein
MDLSSATIKIAKTVVTVNEYVDKIKALRDKYVKKINGYLEDIENTINGALTKSQEWLEMKLKKIIKKIEDCLSALMKKISDIIDQLKTWYDKQIITIKKNIITAACAKVGIDCDETFIAIMQDLIPHPSLDSMLPSINIEIDIPDVSELINIGTVRLPRL